MKSSPKRSDYIDIDSIPYRDCDGMIEIGESTHKIASRLKEHKKAVKHKQPRKSILAEHSFFGLFISVGIFRGLKHKCYLAWLMTLVILRDKYSQ